MRRLVLAALAALTLALTAAAPPARAGGILVIVDSLATVDAEGGQMKTMAPFFDALTRSVVPGTRIAITNAPTMASPNSWTLAELRDSIGVGATNPKYNFDVVLILGWNDTNYLVYTSVPAAANNRALGQITKALLRPRVPVMYISVGLALHSGSGDDSLGVFYHSDVTALASGNAAFAKSPAGFAFPNDVYYVKKRSTGAGLYVTPVLSLAFYSFTKSDPDGVGGGGADSISAAFYNPPFNSTRADSGSTNGYAWMNWKPSSTSIGSTNYSCSGLGVIAVGMLARLAPTLFAFPAQHVALDVDDGVKRFGGQSSLPQVQDALAGLDSLGVWKIPYGYGMEVDSLAITDTNGSTRFANEWAALRRYGMGKATVHDHHGFGTDKGGNGVADSTDASASGGVFPDIFGSNSTKWPFGTTASQRDKSVYALLNGATRKLVQYAGDPNLVTRHVMPPTDDYTTQLVGSVIKGVMPMDSVAYAIALAGCSIGHGYRVVRTQYLAANSNLQESSGSYIGGVGRGTCWPLPGLGTVATGVGLSSSLALPRGLLFAPSRYLWGTTTDTVSTTAQANIGQMHNAMDALLGSAVGFNRNIDLTTAQQAVEAAGYSGIAKGVIWVTHLPNWRAGIGVTPGNYNGTRPAWENVRMVNGVMQAAKWAAQQANTSTTTYFRDGPIGWVWPDEITERDIR